MPTACPHAAPLQLVVFLVEGQQYALPLSSVDRVVHAVEVTPLPGAPPAISGAITVAGQLMPVLDLRKRFLLPWREIRPDDQFVIARSSSRAVVLVTDEVHGVVEIPENTVIDASDVAPGLQQFMGLTDLGGRLVLIQDLDEFLSLEESRSLDEAMDAEE